MAAKKKVVKKSKKKEIEFTANCACGQIPVKVRKLYETWGGKKYSLVSVECSDQKCWRGPQHNLIKEAIKLWNDVMAFLIHNELKHIKLDRRK